MKLEDHCFNAAPPGQRDAVSCVTLSMAIAAIEQARREVKEECAMIADRRTLQTNLEIAAAIRARKP